MSDTGEHTGADGIPEENGEGMPSGPDSGDGSASAAANTRQARDEVREEVRLDLDEGSIDEYEAVRKDYATDPDSDMTRPAMTEKDDAAPASAGSGKGEFDNAELVEEEDVDQEEDDWSPRRDEEE